MYERSRSTIVSIVSKLQDGESGARILEGARGFFLLSRTSRLAQDATYPPNQWVMVDLSQG